MPPRLDVQPAAARRRHLQQYFPHHEHDGYSGRNSYSSRNSPKNTNERPARASFFHSSSGTRGRIKAQAWLRQRGRTTGPCPTWSPCSHSCPHLFVSVSLAAVPVTCPAGIINTSLPSGQRHHETPRYLPGLELKPVGRRSRTPAVTGFGGRRHWFPTR